MKTKILVTGGAGYIGSHTCVELIEAGYQPIIIDNFSNSEKFIINRIEEITGYKPEVIEADCIQYNQLVELLNAHKIEGLIHFAALKAVGESAENPLLYYENNVLSTVNMLKLSAHFNITNFVFSSSCTVYGQPKELPVTEKSPVLTAESPYGRTKQICEDIISDFTKSYSELKAISLRYFNPIGAHPTGLIGELPLGVPNNLVPFITQTAAGLREELSIFGKDYETPDGTCIRDYIHVVDIARAHVSALKFSESKKLGLYDVFNLGSGVGDSVLHVVKTFESVSKKKLNYKFAPRRRGDVVSVYAEVSKSKEIMGWSAKLSLEDALKDAWRWQLSLENNN